MSDLIKREDAIKAMEQRYEDILRTFKRKVKVGEKAIVLDMIGCVKNLPSADTELEIIKAEAYAKGIDSERKRISDWCRPSGEWLWQLADNGWADHICSVCGYTKNTDIHVSLNWSYCPHCGSKMRGEHDD